MDTTFQKAVRVRLTLLLVLITSTLGVKPAHANSDPDGGFLNSDGVLNIDANTLASFQAEDWDVKLDPERGPIFSSEDRESLSPLAATTIGNWFALGSNPAGTDGAISHPITAEVDVIAVSGTDVYVGGCFQNTGGDPTADYIAKWDGTNWSGLGNDGAATPDGALKSCIRALAVNGDDVYVGGYPTLWVNGVPAPQAQYLAKWDGTSWSGLGNNGAGGSSISNQVTSIAISGNDVYVGGYFMSVNNYGTSLDGADYIAKWDTLTENWSAVGNNGNGTFQGGGGVDAIKLINSDLYVGGAFTTVFNGWGLVPEAAYIAKWNTLTESWSALGSNGDLPGGPINGSVYGLATDGTNLYVAGAFTDVNNNGNILSAADYIAKWDTLTGNWSALGSNGAGDGSLNFYPTAIQVNGSDIYVGGTFTDVNNSGTVLSTADYIAKWDALTGNWSALGSNGSGNGSLNLNAWTLGLIGDTLYVGGRFTNVNNNGTGLNTADYISAYEACTSESITVQNTNDSGPDSLRQAIADICEGGTISFDASLAGQTITLSSTLVIDKDLTIDGSALVSEISISGNNSVRVFIVNSDVTATINNLIIQNGKSTTAGGGIYNSGFLTVVNSIFFGNNVSNNMNSSNGGAIANYGGTLIVTDSIFTANNALGDPDVCCGPYGGAIYSESIPGIPNALTVTNSIFDGNAAFRGGAIACLGTMATMTLTNSTYFFNTALAGPSGNGGAIFDNDCNSIITNSTFSANTASNIGGAIFADNDINPVIVTNSTFYDNTATAAGGGIGNFGELIITNSTFSDNSASNGGAIRNSLGGVLSLRSSILANSIGSVDCINTSEMESIHNLIETTGPDLETSCGVPYLSSDPMLGPLADNGGFTQTMALGTGSPAIDAGDDANCPETDQRGVERPQGSHCDIGAYEFEGAHVEVTIGGSLKDSYDIPSGSRISPLYPDTNNGPVQVHSTNGVPIITSERAYRGSNYTDWNEMLGLPVEQLTTEYWFPLCDGTGTAQTFISIGNASQTPAEVTVKIAGQILGSYTIPVGGRVTPDCAGINNGPVQVYSTNGTDIIVSERAYRGANFTDWNEMMGLPVEQLTTEYWFPLCDGIGTAQTFISIGNASQTPAEVTVKIAGQILGSYTIPVGGRVTPDCAGINN